MKYILILILHIRNSQSNYVINYNKLWERSLKIGIDLMSHREKMLIIL